MDQKRVLLNSVKTPPPFFFSLLCCLFSLCFVQNAIASNLEKEKRWAEQISDSLLDGEAIKLHNGSHNFLAIETQAENANDLGVIVLHGIGVHPSLQLPILKNEAEGKDYEPLLPQVPARIDAGIRQLSKLGVKRVALVAHSMGARMAAYYLVNKKIYQEAQTETPIVAFVSIGMGTDDEDFLGKIKIPVFDVYGENDLPAVLASVPDRLTNLKANKDYKQLKVAKADHFFDDQDEALLKVVAESLSGF